MTNAEEDKHSIALAQQNPEHVAETANLRYTCTVTVVSISFVAVACSQHGSEHRTAGTVFDWKDLPSWKLQISTRMRLGTKYCSRHPRGLRPEQLHDRSAERTPLSKWPFTDEVSARSLFSAAANSTASRSRCRLEKVTLIGVGIRSAA